MDNTEGPDTSLKRQRLTDQPFPFFGSPTGSNFMYNNTPYPYGAESQPFPVVRLRGLPFECSDSDIAEFFHGLDIVDVLLTHKNRRFSGEAFCVLGYPVQMDFALQKNRQNMGRRYVEVFRSNRQEYYKAIANEVFESASHGGSSNSPPPRHRNSAKKVSPRKTTTADEKEKEREHTGVLRLRGLPFSAGKDDILEFFKDFLLKEECVHLITNCEGRASGDGFVVFESAEDSRAAMAKDRMSVGRRYIELFPSSREEMEEAVSKGR